MMALGDTNSLTFRWLSGVLVSIVGVLLMIGVREHMRVTMENTVAVQQLLMISESNHAALLNLRRDFDEVKAMGSPITDRRLSVIEFKLGIRKVP